MLDPFFFLQTTGGGLRELDAVAAEGGAVGVPCIVVAVGVHSLLDDAPICTGWQWHGREPWQSRAFGC